MINDIKREAETRMKKSLESLASTLGKVRTGRAHPGILEGIRVDYYGSDTPLSQLANIHVEDARTLTVTPWDRQSVPAVEKAILKSDLGLNPSTAGTVIRIPMPPLTEETRKGYIRQVRHDAEGAKVAVRNVRRDAIAQLKDLVKEKLISEDDDHRAQDDIQKLTDRFIADVDKMLAGKEEDLMAF